VASKHFENAARQAWWSVHIEAWRRSGLAQTHYCRQQRLHRQTFARWLTYLAGKEAARKHVEYQAELRRQKRSEERENGIRKRQRRRYGVSTDVRSQAVQAFWAMHVEALNWSGMSVREYAAGLQLSPTSLRKWRDRFEDGEVEVDWRAHLHPSARPQISTGVKPSAKESASETDLTVGSDDVPQMPKPTTRRSFTDEEKLAIAAPSTPAVLLDLLQPPDGMRAVELPDGRRVFAPVGSNPETVRRHVSDREAAR
jgi:transposase-like protein